MIYQTLKSHPQHREALKKLLESSFHYTNDFSVFEDFAPLFAANNHQNNHLLLNKENHLIGHCGAYQRQLKIRDKKFEITLLGGICIDTHYQGQGLFSDFFYHVINTYKDKTTLFLLWSDLSQLYNHFDFYEAGIQYQTGSESIHQNSPAGFTHIPHSNICTKLQKQIKSVFEQFKESHPDLLIMERTDRDWENYFNISSAKLYIQQNNKKELLSYFYASKGMDLQDIVHDYAFLPEQKKHFYHSLKKYRLWTPQKLFDTKDCETKLYLSFMKIGQHEQFSQLAQMISSTPEQQKDTKKDEGQLLSDIFSRTSFYIGGLESI